MYKMVNDVKHYAKNAWMEYLHKKYPVTTDPITGLVVLIDLEELPEIKADLKRNFPDMDITIDKIYGYFNGFSQMNKRIQKPRLTHPSLTCPVCGSYNVLTRKTISDLDYVLRDRECQTCNYEWSTVEIDSDMLANFIKLGGRNYVW